MFKFIKKYFTKKEVKNEIFYELIEKRFVKVTKNGQLIIAEANPSDYSYTKKIGKTGLINQRGIPLLPLNYDSISFDGKKEIVSQSGELKTLYTKVTLKKGDNVKEISFEEFENFFENF